MIHPLITRGTKTFKYKSLSNHTKTSEILFLLYFTPSLEHDHLALKQTNKR